MKTVDELKTFYEQELLADLKELEQRRQGIFRGLGIALVVFLFLGIVLIAVLFPVLKAAAFIVPSVMLVVLYLGLCFLFTSRYKKDFKDRVIGRLIQFFDPGLRYFPSEKIPKSLFVHSGIFSTKPNRYKGDDLVRGKLGRTEIEFSEILAQYVQSNGRLQRCIRFFRGCFLLPILTSIFTRRSLFCRTRRKRLLAGSEKCCNPGIFPGRP